MYIFKTTRNGFQFRHAGEDRYPIPDQTRPAAATTLGADSSLRWKDEANQRLPKPNAHSGSGSRRHAESGVVLVVCLLILLVLTLIGVTSTRSTTLQQRMAGNQYDRELAFQAAEAGLRAGERYLEAMSLDAFDGTNGLYDVNTDSYYPPPDDINFDSSYWQSSSTATRAMTASLPGYDAGMLPRYYIVHTTRIAPITSKNTDPTHAIPPSNVYRIVARGTGPDGKSPVVLQSFYKR